MAVQSFEDVQIFSGVMDGDTEKRLIKSGNYIELVNARHSITNGQRNGSIEDTEGNLLVSNPFLSSVNGTNKTVLVFEDIKDQSIIYGVCNSLGYHGLFRWYINRPSYNNGVIEKIFQVTDPTIYNEFNKNPLNFHPDYLITGVNLVDNLLCYTDYYNDPKQIDVVRANETNKKRKFDFYINESELYKNVTYTFSLINPDGTIFSNFSALSFEETLSKRVKDIANQINNAINIGIRAIPKTNYIEIELFEPGKYLINISDTGAYPSRILANNFYYDNLPGNYFNRIQAPPFCRPNAYYVPAGPPVETDQIRGFLDNLDVPVGGSTVGTSPQKYFYSIGIGTDVNDLNNNIVLGATNVVIANYNSNILNNMTYPAVASWIRTQNGSLTFTVKLELELILSTTVDASPPSGFIYIPAQFWLAVFKVTPSGNTSFVQLLVTDFPGPITPGNPITHNYNYTSPPINISGNSTDKFFIGALGIGVNMKLTNAQVDLGSISIGNSKEAIIKQTNMFRNKYIYENFQKSVYGQATSIILRTEGYKGQFAVQVNFNDKFLDTDSYCSRIKEIVCSYSKDGGLTWYDYDTLEPYQFACVNSRYVFFDNKKTALIVDPAEAILEFHAVPLLSKSQDYVDGRIIDGGIVEGYNIINVDFDIDFSFENYKDNTYYTSGQLPISVEGWKPGYSGYIGIVYYDDFDRKTSVCLSQNSKINIPYYPSPLAPGDQFNANCSVWNVLLSLYNEPPSWATKYRIVRTKDFSNTTYLMWVINSVELININGTTGGAIKYFQINFDNIQYYTTKAQRGAIIEYTYTVGDRVKIITDKNGVLLPKIIDLEIKFADTDNIYLDYDPLITITEGCLIEIYSKSSTPNVEDSLFFEMGECFEIKSASFGGILKKYHTGNNFQEQTVDQQYLFGGVVVPAKIRTNHGGAYYRNRKMYYTNTSPFSGVEKSYWINSNYADEFELSKEDGLTRPNSIIRIGNISRPPSGRFSNRYKSGSEINGLNENEPLNEYDFPTNYGLISKLQVVNNDILKVIFSNSYQASIYISQGVIRQLQNNTNLISVTDKVVENSHIIQRTMGTVNPESVSLNDEADLMGYDENDGTVWRASGNGLISISDYGQKSNFKNWSEKRKQINRKKSQTPSVYDLYHDEYILSLGSLPAFTGKPASVTFNILSPGKNNVFTIHVYVEETGQNIIPTTTPNLVDDVNDYIASVMVLLGWTRINNSDGSITMLAPNPSLNNKTIIVDIVTVNTVYGKELIRNGSFIPPPNTTNWITEPGWTVNPLPGLPLAEYSPVSLSPGKLYQENIELIPGNTYKLSYDTTVNASTIRSNLGSGTGSTPGSIIGIYDGNVTEELLFNDVPKVLEFIPGNLFTGIVENVSLKLNLGFEFTYKFIVSGYEPASSSEESFTPVTIAFSKNDNGWTHKFDFAPEMFGRLGDNIVCFKDGGLWLHTTRAIPKNYFGIQYSRKFTFICNKDFPKIKNYKELSVNGIGKNKAIIKIAPYEGYPNGMESELTYSNFKTLEGIQYSVILKDKLTPGYIDQIKALLNGRDMRGQVLEVTLINDLPETSLIFNTNILYFYSENS